MKISFFESIFKKTPVKNIEAEYFFKSVKTGKWKKLVENVRMVKDNDKRDKKKKKLPVVTISGIFKVRKVEALIKHSGLLCLDVDSSHNPHINDWSAFRNWIGNMKDVVFAALSASGKGVFAVVKIAKPEKHFDYFQAVSKGLSSVNIIVDPTGKDVSRARFVSYDPEAIINLTPALLKLKKPNHRNNYRKIDYSTSHYNDNNNFMIILNKIIKSGKDITGNYNTWFTLGCCIASVLGNNGREYFHAISCKYQSYSQIETDKEYDKILKYKYYDVPEGYLFQQAKIYGITLV